MVKALAAAHPGPLADLLMGVTSHMAGVAQATPLGGVL